MKFLKKSCGLNHYLNTHQFIYFFLKRKENMMEKKVSTGVGKDLNFQPK